MSVIDQFIQIFVYLACFFLSAPIVISAFVVLFEKPEECDAMTGITEVEILTLANAKAEEEYNLLNGGKRHGDCN